jgi:hypothetical protein
MACKGSAVRSRLAPPDPQARRLVRKGNGMERAGRIMVYLGIILIATGLIGGFVALFQNADGVAVNLLFLVPLGFVALLTGTVISQLLTPPNNQ